MDERRIDIVHVGSACRDIAEDDPRGWRLGGGTSYAALTTARLGLRTAAVVGVDDLAASSAELELLRAAGVELLPVHLAEGPVFHNRDTPTGRVQTSVTPGHGLPVPDLPTSWREASAWSLVPVAGELGDDWVAAVPPGPFVSLGWQGLLRNLPAGGEVSRRAPSGSPLLDRVDMVGVSRHDLEPGTDPVGLLGLLRPGARLVVTDGPAGGRLLQTADDDRILAQPYVAIAPSRDVDPTGAGDVFLAALVASIVRPDVAAGDSPRGRDGDLRFAATAASFVIEAPGLLGVPDRRVVLERLARGRSLPPALD